MNPPVLRAGDVHVWCARLDVPLPVVSALSSMLSGDEQARAARFRSDTHRQRFIVGRAAQRTVLGAYAGIAPDALAFRYSAHGKPSIESSGEHARRIRFNTSNSGDLAVCAVTAGREIGVDVEVDRAVSDALTLARRFFSPSEYSALVALPPDMMQHAFVTCWTRKEAFIKAVGLGVSMPLGDFDVSFRPDEPAALLATRPDPAAASRWRMHAVDAGAGYVCALVVEGPTAVVRTFEWQPPASAERQV